MTSLLVSIPAASPRATAFALDCAHARARGGAWIADFDADPRSAVEEAGLLVQALAHGAEGAWARGRMIGSASDLFSDAPAQDRGLGIEETRREEAGTGESGVGALAPEGAGVETVGAKKTRVERTGVEVEGGWGDAHSTPLILCLSTMPAASLAIQRWHASSWEAGYSLGVREAQEFNETLQGLSEALLKGNRVPRGVEDGERHEWGRGGKLPRILIADSSIEEEGLVPLVEEGMQVILDYCTDGGDEGVLDSGFLVDRISRARRHANPPAGTPGPLFSGVAPTLKRAMDRLLDPPPAARSLQARASLLVDQGEEEETIALHPAGGAAITREPLGRGALWRIGSVVDSATRRGLLSLIGAYARVQPSRADLPDGIEAAQRGRMLLLINHADRAREISGVFGTDRVSGSLCTGHVVLGRAGAMAVSAL